MTLFLVAAAVLLLLAAAMLLRRRNPEPRAADIDDPNLAWYRTRAGELAGADPELVEEARLRLLEDGLDRAAAADRGAFGRLQLSVLFCVVVLGAALIYGSTGAIEDVLIYRELRDVSADASAAEREALRARIAARSDARPDNLQYLSLLGRLDMAAEDFAAASEAFARLAERAPEDPQALAMAAQARFLASGRELDREAQLLAERALAVDPEQSAALGLLGMASFEAGAYKAAATYWERLRALEARGSPAYEMLSEVLALARERGGLSAPEPGGEVATAGEAVDGPGISVSIRLAEEAAARPDATIFVFARPAEQGGMPVAVRRLLASQLPLTLRLTDSDAMAGQRLSEAGAVLVSAQLSSNGQPGEANAVYSGVAGPVAAGGRDVAVTIELGGADERG